MGTMYLKGALEETDVKKRTDGRKHKNAALFKAVVSKLTEQEKNKHGRGSVYVTST